MTEDSRATATPDRAGPVRRRVRGRARRRRTAARAAPRPAGRPRARRCRAAPCRPGRWPGCSRPRTCPASSASASPVIGTDSAAVQAEQHDPGAGEQRPHQLPDPPALHQREQQRPDELDRHRDAERHVLDREVEHQVHRAHRQAQRRRGRPLLRATTRARPRPDQRGQQQPGDGQPQQRHARRAGHVERRPRHGAADLHRRDRDQHQHRRRYGGGKSSRAAHGATLRARPDARTATARLPASRDRLPREEVARHGRTRDPRRDAARRRRPRPPAGVGRRADPRDPRARTASRPTT